MIAHSREEAIRKLKSPLQYCKSNKIIPQYTKCEFVAVNGTEADREPLPFGEAFLQHASHIVLLGSHLTNTGSVAEDLQLHMKKRHPSVIKAIGGVRGQKNMSSLFCRTHCCGFNAFYGMSKFNSVPKI